MDEGQRTEDRGRHLAFSTWHIALSEKQARTHPFALTPSRSPVPIFSYLPHSNFSLMIRSYFAYALLALPSFVFGQYQHSIEPSVGGAMAFAVPDGVGGPFVYQRVEGQDYGTIGDDDIFRLYYSGVSTWQYRPGYVLGLNWTAVKEENTIRKGWSVGFDFATHQLNTSQSIVNGSDGLRVDQFLKENRLNGRIAFRIGRGRSLFDLGARGSFITTVQSDGELSLYDASSGNVREHYNLDIGPFAGDFFGARFGSGFFAKYTYEYNRIRLWAMFEMIDIRTDEGFDGYSRKQKFGVVSAGVSVALIQVGGGKSN